MPEFSVETQGLGKAYRMYSGGLARAGEFLSLGRWRGHREFWALRDLDLQVKPGTVLGICGSNGAGKSTLLKILSGTTTPTVGRYRVRGRVMSLLELGLGFRLDMTGRENLFHHGTMLGYSTREMEGRIDEIVEFAELGEFIDEPLRTYSSGMGMRLGFSVSAMLDPDVLVLDEVFAVGDVAFQKKCIDKIHGFKERNRTVLFCSHSIYDLRTFCDEAIWIRDGDVAEQGDPTHVTGEYYTWMRTRADLDASSVLPAPGVPHVREIQVCRMGTDEIVREIETGDSIEVRVAWEKPADYPEDLNLAVGLVREDNVIIVGVSTHFRNARLRGRAGVARLRLPNLPLLSGRYLVPVWLMDETGAVRFHEAFPNYDLAVRATTEEHGVFRPEHEWVLEAEPAPAVKTPG